MLQAFAHHFRHRPEHRAALGNPGLEQIADVLKLPVSELAICADVKETLRALLPVLAGRWSGSRLGVHATHPGWADTPGVVTSLPVFHKVMGPLLRDPALGADKIVWLAATDPAPGGGQFWMDRAPRPEHYLPTTRASAADLDHLWSYVVDSLSLPAEPGDSPARAGG